MTTMPGSTNTISDLEPGNILTDCNDISYKFVSGYAGKDIAHVALRGGDIGEADTAGEDLDEDLALFGVFEFDVFN